VTAQARDVYLSDPDDLASVQYAMDMLPLGEF